MAAYSYSFQNQKRDLSDVLSTVIAESPRFIGAFPTVADSREHKHEWMQDQTQGRLVKATAVASMVMTVSSDDAAKLSVGTRIAPEGDTALFKVKSISGTSITVELEAANGSTTSAPEANKNYKIITTPIAENSTGGEKTFHQSGNDYNYTQIFRKDIEISGTALAIDVYGLENAIARQTQFALEQLTRDLNRAVIFGHREQRSGSANGQAGGLYDFGLQSGGLSVNANSARFDSFIVNDGAQGINENGGFATMVLCGPGQSRVLSAELKDRLTIVRQDTARGAYVAEVVNDMNGSTMRIIADPDIPDTEAWVIDPAGFGLSNLKGRAIWDEDTTAPGSDGIRRTAMGELTFEFKNAKQRLCRIYGLKSSATALSEIRSGIPQNVFVSNTTSNPVNTKEVSGSN